MYELFYTIPPYHTKKIKGKVQIFTSRQMSFDSIWFFVFS